MPTTVITDAPGLVRRTEPRDAGPETLWSLVYHSRASRPMDARDLSTLQAAAAGRNRREGLTGLLIYDEGRFFQWIEGPNDALERVWQSIQRDPRHGEIDLLGRHPAPVRCFGDWDMKLSTRSPQGNRNLSSVLPLPQTVIESLHRRPDAATELLASMALRAPVVIARETLPRPGSSDGRDRLRSVVESLLIPQLAALHLDEIATPQVAPGIAELARLLLAADPRAGLDRLSAFQTASRSAETLCTHLYEPLARSLGDLWLSDDCTELELTIALCRVQTAVHQSSVEQQRRSPTVRDLPAVLVSPQPGEQHRLGASLDAELLWQAGWNPQLEAPATNSALEQLVADTWFDALDLSLSNALRREHWLPRMATTIQQVRAASQNPQMVVIVGGRVFHDHENTGRGIGADAGTPSATQLAAKIMATLK